MTTDQIQISLVNNGYILVEDTGVMTPAGPAVNKVVRVTKDMDEVLALVKQFIIERAMYRAGVQRAFAANVTAPPVEA